jgi:uncharacterized protein YcaQ
VVRRLRTASSLSKREARWLALAAQQLGPPRPRRATRRHLEELAVRLGAIQLDAINVLERTQFLVPWSRLGGYAIADLLALSGRAGLLFEYWGHAASLLPVARQPLFRWRMATFSGALGGTAYTARWRAWGEVHAAYVASVLAEVRERGPLAAGQLSDPRRRDGEWWERRSVGRQALEWLFARGELAAWRNDRFERVYDLPERVIPREVLARPEPTRDDAQRALLLAAANALGVGTLADLADYYRIAKPQAGARVAELVEAAELEPVEVEGWAETAYCPVGASVARPTREHATLLSPFDSLIWERRRTRRLFGFDYRIEVYTPAARRRHGYYVLPLLLGDALVARLDLKADRRASVLRVEGAWAEPDAKRGAVAAAAAAELDLLRVFLGLDGIHVGPRGDLATGLRAELPGARRRRAERPHS